MPGFLETFGNAFISREKALEKLTNTENDSHRLPTVSHTFFEDTFFADYTRGPRPTIISGGDTVYRTKIARGILIRLSGPRRIPVIILHCGNPGLSCDQTLGGASVEAGTILRCDPLKGKSKRDVSRILATLGTSLSGLKPGMTVFWNLVQDLMELRGIEVSLSTLCDFPCSELADEVLQLLDDGLISNEEAKALQNRCNRFDPMDAATAEDLLQELSCNSLGHNGISDCLSLDEVVLNRGIASIDLVSDSKLGTKELCFLILQKLMEDGHQFLVVCDGLSVSEQTKHMCSVLQNPAEGVHFIFSGNDVPSLLNKCPGMLDSMIHSTNAVIFRHTSGIGKDYWKAYLGNYRHKEWELSVSAAKDNTALIRRTETKSATLHQELRDVLDEEGLRKMPLNQAVVSMPACDKYAMVSFPALATR